MYTYNVKEVIRVVDGDTIDLVVDLGFSIFHRIRVRLLGIDAPETRTKDLEEKARGLEAKEFLTIFMDDNRSSEIIVESEKLDSFGRSLANVYVNGASLALELLRNKHAEDIANLTGRMTFD